MKNAHEFVIFNFIENVSMENQKKLMAQIDNCANKLDGFVKREYYYSKETKKWIDHVVWKDHQSAINAGENIMKDPAAQEVFKHIDESNITMSHFDLMN